MNRFALRRIALSRAKGLTVNSVKGLVNNEILRFVQNDTFMP